ncbi:MAG: hypothetical protein QUS07_04775 [Methanothrix sp.]|nr:hypothetical protein [Methanothrix sp.]
MDPEAFLIIKTSRECFEMLRKRIATPSLRSLLYQ